MKHGFQGHLRITTNEQTQKPRHQRVIFDWEIADALIEHGGHLPDACKASGINYDVAKKRCNKNPDLLVLWKKDRRGGKR